MNETTWREQAACRNVGPDVNFHPERGDSIMAAKAKAICATCPVTEPCLQYAFANGERQGIWGGYSYPQRRRMREKARKAA